MKRILGLIFLVVLLTACNADTDLEDVTYNYDLNSFTIEINSDAPDYQNLIDCNYDTFSVDDSNVDYTELGNYSVFLSVENEEQEDESITVTIVDTTGPEFIIPSEFKTEYEYGEAYSVDQIIVSDNSLESVNFTHRLESNMMGDGYNLILTAEDSSGNETIESIALLWDGPAIPNGTIDISNITYNSFDIDVSFSDPDQLIEVRKIEIYEGLALIRTVTLAEDQFVFQVTGVMQSQAYDFLYVIEYELDNDDEYVYMSTNCTTLTLDSPTILLENIMTNPDSVSLDVSFNDEEGLLEDITLLFLDKSTLMVKYTTEISSEGTIYVPEFLNDYEYRIEARYSYDISDGRGFRDDFNYVLYLTDALTVPTIELEKTVFDPAQISTSFVVTDPDSIFLGTTAVLSDSTGEVETIDIIADYYIANFYDLVPRTNYIIDFTFHYDLNDGQGVRRIERSDSGDTAVMIVSDFFVDETELTVDVPYTMVVDLNNPGDFEITGFRINGERLNNISSIDEGASFEIYDIADNNYLYNTFNLEAVYYMDGLEEKAYITNENYEILMNGKIEIIEVTTTEEYRVIDYDKVATFRISLYNPMEYPIETITVNGRVFGGVDVKTNDSNTLVSINIDVGHVSGERNLNITEIKFTKGIFTITRDTTGEFEFKYNVEDFSTFIEMYTAFDFYSIQLNPDYNYVLMNDIDLGAYSSVNLGSFNGTLNGNGYTVSNISHDNPAEPSQGLFTDLGDNAYIYDINFTNMVVEARAFSDVLIAGMLAGEMFDAVVENVTITGRLTVDCNNSSIGCQIGGLSGFVDESRIEDVKIDVVIEISIPGNDNLVVGGLVGGARDTYLSNIFVQGLMNLDLHGNLTAGGLAGEVYRGSVLENSYANMEMDVGTPSIANIGGLIGHTYLATVMNCYSAGSIYENRTTGPQNIGGLIGQSWDTDLSHLYSNTYIDVTALYSLDETYIGGLFGKLIGTGIVYNVFRYGDMALSSFESFDNTVYYGNIYGTKDDFLGTYDVYYANTNKIIITNLSDSGVFQTTQQEDYYIVVVEGGIVRTDTFYSETLEFDSTTWAINVEADLELPTIVTIDPQDPIAIE